MTQHSTRPRRSRRSVPAPDPSDPTRPTREPAHLARLRRDPAPWARSAQRHAGARAPRPARHQPRPPVFVDDSGRRRRAGRWIGGGLGAVVLAYVAVVGLTFAGVPVGLLAPPGVEQLSRPSDDHDLRVTPGAQENPIPAAGTGEATSGDAGAPAVTSTDDPGLAGAGTGTATTSTTTGSTTTTRPGNGATTSVPGPGATVPDRTHTTGPPSEPPGKP